MDKTEKLKTGDIIHGEIFDLTREGTGFFRAASGISVFVHGAWPTEVGDFRVTKVDRRFAVAEIVKLDTTASARRQSPCPHYGLQPGQCGGCSWMEFSYEAQVEAKRKIVADSLKFKKIPLPESFDIWAAPHEFGYRNRAQIKTDGATMGFVSRGTNTLVKIDKCLLLNEKSDQIFQALRSTLPNSNWKPKGKSIWSTLDIDDRLQASDIEPNSRQPFRQAYDEQNQRMKAWVTEKSANWQRETLELFAGSGNFTESLAKNPQHKISAVESVGPALKTLKEKLPQVRTKELDLYQPRSLKELQQFVPTAQNLLLDPPRDGFPPLKDLLPLLKSLKNVLYVSCNIHSFASDAFDLIQHGFVLQDLKAVDQFPQTPHIEILSMFSRR